MVIAETILYHTFADIINQVLLQTICNAELKL